MRTIAIVNQKGGCGKTTTAINLAAVLARGGARTLLVDMDPQSHCAAGLGIPEAQIEFNMALALLAEPASVEADVFLWEVARNLKLAPSTMQLAALESAAGGLASRPDRDQRLARLLDRFADLFDWAIVDCPPTIGLLTFNALRAADEILVPVETGFFALRGAERQVATIRAVAERLQRAIPLRLLPSMHRTETKVAQEVLAAVARRFPELVLPVVVREHELLREAASFGQAIVEFAPESPAHEDFRQLAEWLKQHPVERRPSDSLAAGSDAANGAVREDGPISPPVASPFAAGLPSPREAASSARAAEVVARMRGFVSIVPDRFVEESQQPQQRRAAGGSA